MKIRRVGGAKETAYLRVEASAVGLEVALQLGLMYTR